MIETRGEEIAVGVERAAAFLAQNSRARHDARDLHVRRRLAHSRASTRCSPKRLRLTVQQANPLANLKVRDGALESLVTDEIAPLLMLPIGLGASAGRMIRNQSSPGAGRRRRRAARRVDFGALAAGFSGQAAGQVPHRRGRSS